MRRVLRWGLGLLAFLILLPVLLLGGVLAAANTAPGQKLIADLAQRFVPGLTIEGLHGPIPGAPGFARLRMADAKGVWLEVEQARLDIDLRALLSRELRIETLQAARIALLRLPESDPNAPPPEPTPSEGGPIPTLPNLPVALRLERLSIARIEIPRELVAATVEEHGPAPFFALSAEGQASLVAAALQAKLGVQRLEAEGRLDLDLALDPQAALKADLRVAEPAGGVLATALGIATAPAELRLSLDGPASGAALRASADFGGQAGFNAEGQLALDAQGGGALALRGHLDAPAPLAPEPVRAVDFAIDAKLPAGGQPELASLRLSTRAGEITAQGNLARLQAEARLAPSAVLGDLIPAGFGWQALTLTATVEEGERIQAALRPQGLTAPEPLSGALGPAPEADYRGTIFRIDSLDVRGQGARLQASGTGWQVLDLTALLELPELQRLRPELSGPARLEARITGPAADPAIRLEVTSPGLVAAGRRIEEPHLAAEIPSVSGLAGTIRLTGRAEGQPVSLDLRAAQQGEMVRLDAASLTFGPVQAKAEGSLNTTTTRFDGSLEAEAQNLAPLSGLIGQEIAGGFRLRARLNPTPEGLQAFDARAETQRIALGGKNYAASMTLKGTDAALDWQVQGRLPQADVQGQGRFTRNEQGMRLDIARFEAAQGEMGIRLAAPGAILLPPSGAVEIPGLRLAARPAGNFTLSGRWGPERADLRVALAALPASLVNMFVPEPRLSGTVVGEARITGPTSAPEVNATLNGTGLQVTAPWSQGWPAASLRVQLQRAGSGAIRAEAALRMGQLVTLDATASLPQGPGADAPLNASLRGNANLQPLLAPSLGGGANRVTGRLALDAGASGTLGAPVLTGGATLSGGDIRNPLYGLRLTGIQGRIRADGQRVVIEGITARAGTGTLRITGQAEPLAPGIPLDIAITARDATPVQSELVTALLDADLRFTGPLQENPALGGTVRLRRVAVNIPQALPGGGVATLGEVRERGAGAPPPAAPGPPPAPIALDITVEAPQSILIRGRGLDAELGGRLHVGGTAADVQTDGAFNLRRGTFQLLDRRLTFSKGDLTFDGALTPSLDFEASTTAQGVTITVSITGQPSSPVISFTSEPELPQDEVLARLLFNRPVDRLSPLEIAQLAGGAATLAGVAPGGGRGFLGRLADRLGLDRLGVGNNQGGLENPSLNAGGYLGQGVYLNVEQGTDGGPRVGVEVELTPRLKLESSTGGEDGERVGLSYEFEY
ncbi:translocation/assembly module TamB domain-containing protein [Pseudoroseomonas cervicalis]|uniref:translocation/assembly module TamB domain-containing protein n=1 Tax=Teichococcus cervicalis TaxID=204525 RepID=UPI00277EAC4E|nr:translocation/assembly module TamB domain-containing protein [Pseudoroseomonas cervicalis]MDQ1078703.1 translocation and assembly module TamB [Pseudoroseomonas cervicalis]